MRLYHTLADYPHEMVEIECAKCGADTVGCRPLGCSRSTGLTSSCRTSRG